MTELGDNHSAELRHIVEQLERLEGEKNALTSDIRSIYAKARANGFDLSVLRRVMSIRRKDAAKQRREQTLLNAYLGALGMLNGTPLGTWAKEAEKSGDGIEAARLAGFSRGKSGLPPDPFYQQKSKAVFEAHMGGWHSGNETRLKELTTT